MIVCVCVLACLRACVHVFVHACVCIYHCKTQKSGQTVRVLCMGTLMLFVIWYSAALHLV
jgi:hypothetical protein